MKDQLKFRRYGEHYIRYLFSYMTVLLIPLVILTIFYSAGFMKKFYEEIYETVDLELLQLSTQLENELASMQNIVVQLSLTGTIARTAAAEEPYELSPTITYLSGLTSANSFFDDMTLVMNDKEYVVTSTTTCQRDFYFQKICSLPDPELKTVPDFISSGQTLLFSYPLFSDYQKHEGTALFLVNQQKIERLISQKLQSYESQIYIIDAAGNILLRSGHNDRMQPLPVNIISPDHTGTVTVGQEQFVVRSCRSAVNGWSYVAFIPNRQTTFSQVSSLMREFIAAIVTILFLASLTIFVLQRRNYAPVRRLMNKAREISPEEASFDELATIDQALEFLSRQNTSLSVKLAGSQTAVLNERLYRLLSGHYESREDFNLDCLELELSLPDPCFAVGIVMFHTAVADIEALAGELQREFHLPHVYYHLHHYHPNQIVYLLNLPDKADKPVQLFQEIQQYCQKTCRLFPTVGIGSCTDNTKSIAQSYMEAVSALDYRFVKGNGSIIEVGEVLDPMRVKVLYPDQEFESLRNALVSRNESHIRTAIDNIIVFMEQNQLPLYLARSICFNLVHMVNEHYRGKTQVSATSVLVLSGMETAREIIRTLHDWSESLGQLTAGEEQRAALDDVISYLNSHCLNCDFSAYETAEHFQMTLPAFSKFFKDRTGQNVMDYTINLRIQQAKVLLKTTGLPLKDVAEQVGYYNLSSFTRRFKLHQGITPSEYRRNYGREESAGEPGIT